MKEHRSAAAGEESIVYRPIGIVHTPYPDPDGVPVQGIFSSEKGTVEVFPEYAAGLTGIEGFSHIILIYLAG
ncbi:TrmO family methyltransferase [uncultured Methanofollis sp.]|uniref:TrmO family methyltransferase n=1 Tax=uncultured Methanofollis sp. TaxID=262500 RepID=UPI00318306A4